MSQEDKAGYGWTYRETRNRQARLGLQLTPAQRLDWLESTLLELRKLQGKGSVRRRA